MRTRKRVRRARATAFCRPTCFVCLLQRVQYDVVFCLGVIQHTPNPEETIEHLYAQAKQGGWLVIDHYTYNLSHFTKVAPLVRRVLRQLPPEEGLMWTE